MKIVFLGAPGSGKGSICKLLKQEFNFTHLSTGDVFRATITKNDDFANKLKSIMMTGKLVDDKTTNEVVDNFYHHLPKEQLKNIVFDGYPRNIEQVNYLDSLMTVDYVINVIVPQNELIKRITGRRTCSKCGEIYNIYYKKPKHEGMCDRDGQLLVQRADDCEEILLSRLAEFNRLITPMVSFYKQKNIYYEVTNHDFATTWEEVKKICQLK